MFENTLEKIKNTIHTSKGTHLFYPEYGVRWLDEPVSDVRSDLQMQLSEYFPDVKINSLELKQVDSSGSKIYDARFKG